MKRDEDDRPAAIQSDPDAARRALMRVESRTPPVSTEARITCPLCGEKATETMPENACQYFYVCEGCGETLKPKAGDCCVFCSYADTVCPPKQAA